MFLCKIPDGTLTGEQLCRRCHNQARHRLMEILPKIDLGSESDPDDENHQASLFIANAAILAGLSAASRRAAPRGE